MFAFSSSAVVAIERADVRGEEGTRVFILALLQSCLSSMRILRASSFPSKLIINSLRVTGVRDSYRVTVGVHSRERETSISSRERLTFVKYRIIFK